jgi:hypothetical protein
MERDGYQQQKRNAALSQKIAFICNHLDEPANKLEITQIIWY